MIQVVVQLMWCAHFVVCVCLTLLWPGYFTASFIRDVAPACADAAKYAAYRDPLPDVPTRHLKRSGLGSAPPKILASGYPLRQGLRLEATG